MKMIGRDGAAIDVPDDQVQAAFQSGKYGFPKGSRIPIVTRSGKVGLVPDSEAEEAFDKESRIALPDEYKQAEREAKYGSGIGNQLAANAEGLARGISGGAIDPLAVAVAKAALGTKAAEATREHLAGQKATHPIGAGVSEALGFTLPLLTGAGEAEIGGRLALEGAEAAGGAAKGAEAVDAVKALHGGLPSSSEASALGATEAGLPGRTKIAQEAWGKAMADGRAAGIPAGEQLDAHAAKAAEDAAKAYDSMQAAPATELANAAAPKSAFGAAMEGVKPAIRTAGVIPRGITAAGEMTEKALGKIIGKDATSVVGRAAQKVAARAGAGAVEGALFGIGNEVDEATLGDEDLNGEKLLAAAGHGALLGGALTGILTGGGELAREVAGRASPYMKKLAGLQAFKAGVPGKAYSETAIRRFGGAEAIGGTVLKHGILDGVDTVEGIRDNTIKKIEELGAALGEDYRGVPGNVRVRKIDQLFADAIAEKERIPLAGDEVAGLKEARRDFLERLAPDIAKTVADVHVPGGPLTKEEVEALIHEHGGAGILSDKKKLANLGIERVESVGYVKKGTEAATVGGEPLTGDEMKAYSDKYGPMNRWPLKELGIEPETRPGRGFFRKSLREVPGVPSQPLSAEETQKIIAEHGNGAFEDKALLKKLGIEETHSLSFKRADRVVKSVTPESLHAAALDTDVPVQQLIELRRGLGARAYREQQQNDPKGRAKALREIYTKISDLEDEVFQHAEETAGGPSAAGIKEKRRDLSHLKQYEAALNKSNARYVTNNHFSIRDWGVGLAMLAQGHAAGSVLSTLASKYLRERSTAWTAKALDKLATLSAIERATSAVDREVDRGMAGFFRPGERKGPKLRARVFTGDKEEGTADYKERVKAVAHATAYADAHADHVGKVAEAVAEHAPNTSKKFQRTALAVTSYLASRIPQGHVPPNVLAPHLEEPRVSDAEKAKFNRAFDMAHDPVGTTFDRLNRGLLTTTDVSNLRSMYPKLYDQIRARATDELSGQGAKLDFDKRMQIGMLLDIPADPAIEPLFMMSMQTTWADAAPGNEPPQPKVSAPKRQIEAFEEKAKLSGQ